MLEINWLSPLPPARTGIATYSGFVLPHLAEHAKVNLFTFEEDWDDDLEAWGPVTCLAGHSSIWEELNSTADMTVSHIGNNSDFHALIWQVASVHPSVVVLHDPCLQHLFASMYLHHWQDEIGFLDAVGRCHGEASRRAALEVILGRENLDDFAPLYPMTRLALEEALSVVTHSKQALALAEAADPEIPGHLVPLPFPSRDSPPPERPAPRAGEPFRLVIFGHLWPNRRLEPLMRALAGLSEKDRFHLAVYGRTWNPAALEALRDELGLASQVTLHGWVDDETLENGLENAHLAINLRDPSMGEASLSQLQIYSFALPSLVTKHGWYESLDPRSVRFVHPETEVSDIREALRDLIRDPESFAEMGRRGARILEERHAPAAYAESILSIAEHARDHQTVAVGQKVAHTAVRKISAWSTEEQEAIAPEIAHHLEELFPIPEPSHPGE